MTRTIDHRYTDPLDLIWVECARELGMTLQRSPEVFASWDGRGTLTICTDEHFDADDSLAQFIFHEVCHALVQGRQATRRVDWDLAIEGEQAAVQEHACHRLQAALARVYGLRDLLAVTTDWRPYWDALPDDPLEEGPDPALPLARRAWVDANRGPWSAPLRRALRATAALAQVVRPLAPAGSLWSRTTPLHPLGIAAKTEKTCEGCVWLAPKGRGIHLCRAAAEPGEEGPRVHAQGPACYRYEAQFSDEECLDCGACCREGFSVVGVSPDDVIYDRHPHLISKDGGFAYLDRPNGRCVALAACTAAPWTCAIYKDRPTSCAEFERASDECLSARRRIGKSPQ